jgi:hypothetical protein
MMLRIRDFRGDTVSVRLLLREFPSRKESPMWTVILLLLILVAIGAVPAWPYSQGWGYYPSAGMGVLVLVLLLLMFSGRI